MHVLFCWFPLCGNADEEIVGARYQGGEALDLISQTGSWDLLTNTRNAMRGPLQRSMAASGYRPSNFSPCLQLRNRNARRSCGSIRGMSSNSNQAFEPPVRSIFDETSQMTMRPEPLRPGAGQVVHPLRPLPDCSRKNPNLDFPAGISFVADLIPAEPQTLVGGKRTPTAVPGQSLEVPDVSGRALRELLVAKQN
ncbi:hypothetical protein VTI74DRAFT_7189 [Chaetomium olivicolor]